MTSEPPPLLRRPAAIGLGRVTALVTTPRRGSHLVRILADLPTLQRHIGGYIEGFGPVAPLRGEWTGDGKPGQQGRRDAVIPASVPSVLYGWHAYRNEDGKLAGLPFNDTATRLAVAAGWTTGDFLVGPVVFLGDSDDPAGEANVPDVLLDLGRDLRLWR